jgi:hypothetical protein
MFNKSVFLLAGMTLVTSLGLANETNGAAKEASIGVATETKDTFVHPERKYSITVPTDWTKSEDTKGLDVMFMGPPNPEDQISDATMNVKTGPLPAQISLDQFYSVNIESLKKDFKDFKIIEEGKRLIDGHPTKYIVYSYDQSGMSITIRQYFLIKDQVAYLFTFGAESKYYQDYISQFDQILESIKL